LSYINYGICFNLVATVLQNLFVQMFVLFAKGGGGRTNESLTHR